MKKKPHEAAGRERPQPEQERGQGRAIAGRGPFHARDLLPAQAKVGRTASCRRQFLLYEPKAGAV